MVHIFVINPVAGQGEAPGIISDIKMEAEARGLEFSMDETGKCEDAGNSGVIVYVTKSHDDGENYVRYICNNIKPLIKDTFRFYACGGDGTLNMVLNGVVGFDDVELAQIPYGTGNDFERSLPAGSGFDDVGAQMDGTIFTTDLIKFSGILDGEEKTRYCINMFNIGLDCDVVDLTAKVKKLPFVRGSLAYYLSLLAIFIRKKGTNLKIQYEDGEIYDGKLLLVAIGNGMYCGGGVKGVPKASLDDGRFDVSIVKHATRRDFRRMFPLYQEGRHLTDEEAKTHFEYRKSKKLIITPNKHEMRLCVDGEIMRAGRVEFEIAPACIDFVIPEN